MEIWALLILHGFNSQSKILGYIRILQSTKYPWLDMGDFEMETRTYSVHGE
jgi:hypothetical protein